MNNLIAKLLQKRGVSSIEDLNDWEKEDFDRWEKILSTDPGNEPLTVDQIMRFCDSQIAEIENNWASLGVDNAKKAELIPLFTVYNKIRALKSQGNSERETTERYLRSLLT